MKPTRKNHLAPILALRPARAYRTGFIVLLAMTANAPVLAQTVCAPTDPVFMAEGPLSAISVNGEGGMITALGVPIEVTPGTLISTPTNPHLTMAEFAGGDPFPGRNQAGFLGATVIASGCVKFRDVGADPLTAPVPYAVASEITSDVSENVLLGVVTAPLSSDQFGADGTTVKMLVDPRMPAKPISNAFGFVIDPTTVMPGMNVAIEGYYSDNGSRILHTWAVEVDGAALAEPAKPQVSIQRFDCAGSIEMRGGIYLANGGACSFGTGYSLALFDADTHAPISYLARDLEVTNGAAPAEEFCSYRLRPQVTQCPAAVTVKLLLNGVPIAEASAP